MNELNYYNPNNPKIEVSKEFGNFKFDYLSIEGLVIITPKIYGDSRGHFFETFNQEAFEKAHIPTNFKQDNQSYSSKGVLRGMHIQNPTFQGKLVRCNSGLVYDIAVDLRKGSKTFGHFAGILLDPKIKNMFYVPEGFAHGFLALEDSEFVYKCSETWKPNEDLTISYDCFGAPWLKLANKFGIKEFLTSEKDRQNAITVEQYRVIYCLEN